MPSYEDPSTREEWQDAVDAAKGALALDAARQYGFVRGGPEVNVDRCEAILIRGQALGITPSADVMERFVDALRGGS